MSKPFTLEDVASLVNRENYKLLDKDYVPRQKVTLLCSEGHTYKVLLNNFLSYGNRCTICSAGNSLDNLKKEFLGYGYTIIANQRNTKEVYGATCPVGHKINIDVSNFKVRGDRCKYCSGSAGTIESARKIFAEHNYTLLDSEYRGTRHGYRVHCPNNHKITMNLSKFSNKNSRCKQCRGVSSWSLELIKQKLKDHNFELIAFTKCGEPITVSCPKKHLFTCSNFKNFFRRLKCSKCENTPSNITHTLGYVQQFFIQNNYTPKFTEYKNNGQKLESICPANHEYVCSFANFKKGKRCPICMGTNKKSIESIKPIIEAKNCKLKSDKYEECRKKLQLECAQGHAWDVSFDNFIRGRNCPLCSQHGTSKPEQDLYKWIKSYFPNAKNKHKFYPDEDKRKSLEYDVYIPEKNILIEFDGVMWHSEKFHKDKKTYKKYKLACEQGYQFISIFEDEWLNRKEQIKNHLLSVFGFNNKKIYARLTTLKEISLSQCASFLNTYHIQGYVNGEVAYGLFYEDQLIAAILGGKHHRQNNKDKFVLKRLAFKDGHSIAGGSSKLISVLTSYAKAKGYQKLISWSDNRYSQGRVYQTIGFNNIKEYGPDYCYTKGTKRFSKQSCQKRHLVKLGAVGNTEKEMALSLGLYRLWDCGKKLWSVDIS